MWELVKQETFYNLEILQDISITKGYGKRALSS